VSAPSLNGLPLNASVINPLAISRLERNPLMKYILLIYVDESNEETSPEIYAQYGAVVEDATKAGVWVGGDELQPTSTATTVRIRDGETQTTDGPFAETHEALGGYFLLDCKDLDEALSYAARIPAASMGGSVEVRALNEN